jgi:hypothetical protein
VIDIFAAIGSDQFLSLDEISTEAGHHSTLAPWWELYQDRFEGFCESRLDPMHHRLSHPAQCVGSLAIDPAESILIVGTGPSTHDAMLILRQVRHRVRVVTSPRGAELLAASGLSADLVLIEHRTALDAHHSARYVRDGGAEVLSTARLVAADWRTPPILLSSISRDRLFVPDPLPTWGLWPSTAVALAMAGGARRIGLLGIDLGSPAGVKPEFVPLMGVLSTLARDASCDLMDCGTGAAKDGWSSCSLPSFAGSHVKGELHVIKRPAPSRAAREAEARRAADRLGPVIDRSREMLSTAVAARAGRPDGAALYEAVVEMLAWGDDRTRRIDIQECLGASFLPRFWRSGIDIGLNDALWRPLALAAHEIVGQAASLMQRINKAAA